MLPCSLIDLAMLIDESRHSLLAAWQERVAQLPSAQGLDGPALKNHMPMILKDLVAALRADDTLETSADERLDGNSEAHGIQRQREGFDLEEVVAEYNVLRDCLHLLADRHGVTLSGNTVHVLNRIIDKSVGLAVQTFANYHDAEIKRRREEYLSFVAHDLRTPLSAISLGVSLLEARGVPADPRNAQILKSLQRNVHQLQGLVQQVLEESVQLESEASIRLERRTFDLWPFVERLIHDLRPMAEATGTQLVNAVPEELIVYADAPHLRRVFQNLAANAIKHTPGGEVSISAVKRETDGFVECQVKDNGAGIPAERLDKIFDKFETDSAEPVAGLGLAIVKSFVEAHGGHVGVKSEPGQGATFRFALPPRHLV